MKGTMICALMTLTVAAAGAEVDINSANYILPGCKTNETTYLSGLCLGQIMALGLVLKASADSCIPDAVTYAQITKVVIRYIEARPNRMHDLSRFWPTMRLSMLGLARNEPRRNCYSRVFEFQASPCDCLNLSYG